MNKKIEMLISQLKDEIAKLETKDNNKFQWFTKLKDNIYCMAFSPDGLTLASGSADDTVKLWDAASGQERATLKGHTSIVSSVCFSPDGKTLASGSWDTTIKLWDAASGEERGTFQGHTDPVWSVVFSLDGKTLLSSSYNKNLVHDISEYVN